MKAAERDKIISRVLSVFDACAAADRRDPNEGAAQLLIEDALGIAGTELGLMFGRMRRTGPAGYDAIVLAFRGLIETYARHAKPDDLQELAGNVERSLRNLRRSAREWARDSVGGRS